MAPWSSCSVIYYQQRVSEQLKVIHGFLVIFASAESGISGKVEHGPQRHDLVPTSRSTSNKEAHHDGKVRGGEELHVRAERLRAALTTRNVERRKARGLRQRATSRIYSEKMA
jgi:hypothetical protein